MPNEHQTLADMPFWLLVLISMAGLSGEMLRASGGDLTMEQILNRPLKNSAPTPPTRQA
ncbi:phage holin family protein [Azotobacter beijerinckii]|uniref:Bacteriophage holin Hol, superfamily III n=1 Tax=Azotobacter beijerinckii TaxID=170623 RepID=A0A1I4H941_9GAMM|nr:Bacteriophage holin Hol, superfamily III [Azotobacter beijerinckii]SFL38127.1 Bacteriophage holin Hol, superfamily III [Azotobacter beijerinckii]